MQFTLCYLVIFHYLAFLGSDTKEKITFLKKKDMKKMHQYIDEDQLLEIYGGTLKMPARIWPPTDTYSPEKRASIQPIIPLETNTDAYLFNPEVNQPKRIMHSILENPLWPPNDSDTNELIVAVEGIPVTMNGYRTEVNLHSNLQENQREYKDPCELKLKNIQPSHAAQTSSSLDPNIPDVKQNYKQTDIYAVMSSTNVGISPTEPSSSHSKSRKKCTCTLI